MHFDQFLITLRPMCWWTSPQLSIGSLPIILTLTHTKPKPKTHPISCLLCLALLHQIFSLVRVLISVKMKSM